MGVLRWGATIERLLMLGSGSQWPNPWQEPGTKALDSHRVSELANSSVAYPCCTQCVELWFWSAPWMIPQRSFYQLDLRSVLSSLWPDSSHPVCTRILYILLPWFLLLCVTFSWFKLKVKPVNLIYNFKVKNKLQSNINKLTQTIFLFVATQQLGQVFLHASNKNLSILQTHGEK